MLSPKTLLERRFPWILHYARSAKVVAAALAAGKQVRINIKITEDRPQEYKGNVDVVGRERYERLDSFEVRQSRRSPRRWAYIPGHIPAGNYTVIFKRNY